jgi:hypothetical protein
MRSDAGLLGCEAFENICKDVGYSRAEVQLHYRPLFEQAVARAQEVTGAGAGRATGLDSDSSASGTLGLRTIAASATTASKSGRISALLGAVLEASAGSTRASTTGSLDAFSDGAPTAPASISFADFVQIFMPEPPIELRFKEVNQTTSVLVRAADRKACYHALSLRLLDQGRLCQEDAVQ